MMGSARKWVMGAALAAVLAGPAGAFVEQQGGAPRSSAALPKNWSYELQNGQRVPRGNRVTNNDGSWREEVRQGTCTTVKQKTANGDYSETRKCD